MPTFSIKHRWTHAVLWSGEAENFLAAVLAAVAAGANLRYANLQSADLQYADLQSANLRYADLQYANLQFANLESIRRDFFAVLTAGRANGEVEFLREALCSGKVDGSQYEGACACLVGTLAHARHCRYDAIPGLTPNASRPAERFFLAIQHGDTPKNSQFSALAVQWVDEYLASEATSPATGV